MAGFECVFFFDLAGLSKKGPEKSKKSSVKKNCFYYHFVVFKVTLYLAILYTSAFVPFIIHIAFKSRKNDLVHRILDGNAQKPATIGNL